MNVADAARLIHGARATYRHGCRCVACRASNAAYWRAWRSTRHAGRLPLGARISAAEAHRVIKLLKLDWQDRPALARTLGIRDLPRLSRQQRITLRTELKIRHLYRTRVLEDPDRRRHVAAVAVKVDTDPCLPSAVDSGGGDR